MQIQKHKMIHSLIAAALSGLTLPKAIGGSDGRYFDCGFHGAPFGKSKRTVAQDKRQSKKRKAIKRARRLRHA